MDPANPYQTTALSAEAPEVDLTQDLAPEVVEALRGSRVWMWIVGALASGLGGLSCIGGLVGSIAFMFAELDDNGPMMALIMGTYVALGLVSLIPGVALIRAAIAIGRVEPKAGTGPLTEALRRQKSFWVSLVAAGGISMAVYVIVLVVVIAQMAAKKAGG